MKQLPCLLCSESPEETGGPMLWRFQCLNGRCKYYKLNVEKYPTFTAAIINWNRNGLKIVL